MVNKVKVVICGKDYTMQTAETPNYVYGLARTLEAKINHAMDKTNMSQCNAAVMVALSVLDDLYKANAQAEQLSEQVRNYVDEAGQARIERDMALKEVRMLRARADQLERTLKLRKMKNQNPDAQT